MQLSLPIFHQDGLQYITQTLASLEKDGIISYIHNGIPIYSHSKDNLRQFRFITSKFINLGICRLIDISNVYGVSYDSVKRYSKKLKDEGEDSFFYKKTGKGSCYKLLPDIIVKAQELINEGKSNSAVARQIGVTEGTIRHSFKTGILKKKVFQQLCPKQERQVISRNVLKKT